MSQQGYFKKRVLEDGDPLLAGMALTVEPAEDSDDEFKEVEEAYAQGEQLVRAGGWLTEKPDIAIQDQGASSFLLGTGYLLRMAAVQRLQPGPARVQKM